MTKLRRLLEISRLRNLLDGMLLKETFLLQSFSKRWPLKETFESFLKETFSMKFYGRHSVTSKYSFYLHRLLLYTVLLPLKFSILMFKLFC